MADGNAEQVRIIAEQIADAAVARFARSDSRVYDNQPGPVPPIWKWLAGIAAVLLTAAIVSTVSWLVSSVSDIQLTVARMDERLEQQSISRQQRDTELERRINDLESKNGEVR